MAKKKYIDNAQNAPHSISYKESGKLIQSREDYEVMNPKPDILETVRSGLAFMEEEMEKLQRKVSSFKFYCLLMTLFIPCGVFILTFFVGLLLSCR